MNQPGSLAFMMEFFEAQMACMKELQESPLFSTKLYQKIDKGLKIFGSNSLLAKEYFDLSLEEAVLEKIQRVKQNQIELLGSAKVYEKVDRSLKDFRFEALLAKEQFALYSWRKSFFDSNFGKFGDEDGWGWYTDGADDSHGFDTIPLNITKNFDSVVELAVLSKRPDWNRMEHIQWGCPAIFPDRFASDQVYFRNDEDESSKAEELFDIGDNPITGRDQGWFQEERKLKTYGLSWADALQTAVMIYPSGPPPLLVVAMKKVVVEGLSTSELPVELQIKTESGLYKSIEEISSIITEEGMEMLRRLQQSEHFVDVEDGGDEEDDEEDWETEYESDEQSEDD